MKQIFDQNRVSYIQMCSNSAEIMSDPNLVVQIEENFYPWQQAAPMIMAYLTFKQPLPPDQINASLNQIMLPSHPHLVEEEKKIDEMFKVYEDRYA